ncbi:hypothetical protein [Streptomyces sp. PT12]|uniref:hypothetical protein n=1 Tax=Streptomyces sp. PT12 TaxID=1510197 RepID=UPI000DE34D4A|nr:hypothetical protein [Streptomyces sp. PT12]RBM23867.1 hypothetical protein DEH69_00850 [Streptomyces sp. PT12]
MAPVALSMSWSALLRAAGRTRATMTTSVTADYALLIPLGWLLGVHLSLGLPGLYLAWLAFGTAYAAMLRRYCRPLLRPLPDN